MGYTIYFALKEIRHYSDEMIVEMNKTFARSYRRELSRLEKITGIPFNSIRDKYWSNSELDDADLKLLSQYFPEDNMDCCFIERDINYFKTNREMYDIAIKKAILAVQRKFDDPLGACCDDGFIYDKNGITFTGIGLSEEYQPVKSIKVKFSDMPITFKNKGGEMDTTLSYEWIGYA